MKQFLLAFLLILSLNSAQALIFPVGPGLVMKEIVKEGSSEIFPELKGSNLEGDEFVFPQDFDKELNLVVIAFKRKQQPNINTWIEAYKDLDSSGMTERVAFYELPIIKQMNMFIRFNINNGMRYGIDSKEQRSRTVTFYLDKASFKKRFAISTEDMIVPMLVSQSGKILWRETGAVSGEKLAALKKVIDAN